MACSAPTTPARSALSPPTDLRSASPRCARQSDGLRSPAARCAKLARARALRLSRGFFAGTALLLTTTVGCWEQWSDTWFPQMKRQKAVQAFEEVGYAGRVENLSP